MSHRTARFGLVRVFFLWKQALGRHCATCQVDKTQTWLAKQTKRLMPVHHFMVTFTVPKPVRLVLRAHQREGYTALFQASRETITGLLSNPKFLGCRRAGFLGVLHTWGRDPLVYHPHVHYIVPGGGVNDAGTQWLSTPENFLFPHAAAIRMYKAKFADAMRAANLYDEIPDEAWEGKWVVDIKPVGNGQAALKYLAPYVYRVAINDHRIISCNEKPSLIATHPRAKSDRGSAPSKERNSCEALCNTPCHADFKRCVTPAG